MFVVFGVAIGGKTAARPQSSVPPCSRQNRRDQTRRGDCQPRRRFLETNLIAELWNLMAHPWRSDLYDLGEIIIPSAFSLLTVRPLASRRLETNDRARVIESVKSSAKNGREAPWSCKKSRLRLWFFFLGFYIPYILGTRYV